MNNEYSVTVSKDLEKQFKKQSLHRPMRIERYEPETELVYHVKTVDGKASGNVRLYIEKFVGGGFAGQVYRVRVVSIDAQGASIGGLQKGGVYAIKILIPPSGFSLFFRNALYAVGFQGPFQLQINPAAARAGALWQKFIRRGAKIRFNDERAVVDIHATFIDHNLGSCGEISEWVDGRVWKLEVDDRLDWLRRWRKGDKVEPSKLGSEEFREKYTFMRDFVNLLHDMGGSEFARQYEWSTAKSQPNCLKRNEEGAGLVAVDFRAGLALLPFLPMSPGDFSLILKGIKRGSLVQFDRGDLSALDKFLASHPGEFEDMLQMREELNAAEKIYRDSVPDITHNHFRVLFSRTLWSTILGSALTGWRIKNLVDEKSSKKLAKSTLWQLVFMAVGLLPFLGRFINKIFWHQDWRRHYAAIFKSAGYFRRGTLGKMAELLIKWHRAGRVDDGRTENMSESIFLFMLHMPLSILPAGLHRILTDFTYAKERLDHLLLRPVRLYFNSDLREQWLRDMVEEGKNKNILSPEDSEIILSRIKEPFIQKYLKSLAVHVCTLPVTQVVSLVVAIGYVALHPEMSTAQAWAVGIGILALFQVVPISPGSIVRGSYVVYLVIREKNFKDYNIAVFLGFFKYIGYLAFPIQMAYRYPVLARFMAAHWANESVHIVPVFGESGALLEHWVYRLFYNWPLTLRRRILCRIEKRSHLKIRYWHLVFITAAAAGVFGFTDYIFFAKKGELPALLDIWWLVVPVPVICGALITLGFGGASIEKRITGTAFWGVAAGILYAALSAMIIGSAEGFVAECVWRIFIMTLLSVAGAVVAELFIPDPELRT